MSEFGELVDVALDAPDETLQLREDFIHVGGDFGHGSGENVEIVVTIHFQFAEIVDRYSRRPLRHWSTSAGFGGWPKACLVELG